MKDSLSLFNWERKNFTKTQREKRKCKKIAKYNKFSTKEINSGLKIKNINGIQSPSGLK